MFRSLGQPNVKITPDRAACARYGLNTGDVEAVIQAAIGGQAVTQVYEGEKRFDLTVRWLPQYRSSIEAIREIMVATPDGSQMPLGQLAQIVEEEGPSLIYREDGRRYAPVKFSVRGRDLASTINEAQRKDRPTKVQAAATTRTSSGRARSTSSTRRTRRLVIIVPLTLLLIAFLVYASVKNWIDTLIVLCRHPGRLHRRHLALLVTRHELLGLGGDGLHLDLRHRHPGRDPRGHLLPASARPRAAASRSARARRPSSGLRPVLMTTLVAMFGLLPAALSHGIGSETQKPLAIVVIGGAMVLAILAAPAPAAAARPCSPTGIRRGG